MSESKTENKTATPVPVWDAVVVAKHLKPVLRALRNFSEKSVNNTETLKGIQMLKASAKSVSESGHTPVLLGDRTGVRMGQILTSDGGGWYIKVVSEPVTQLGAIQSRA